MYCDEDRTHYCGMYKGYKVYQKGKMIGNNWYREFYASKLAKKNYVKDKNSVRCSGEELKRYIDNKLNQ